MPKLLSCGHTYCLGCAVDASLEAEKCTCAVTIAPTSSARNARKRAARNATTCAKTIAITDFTYDYTRDAERRVKYPNCYQEAESIWYNSGAHWTMHILRTVELTHGAIMPQPVVKIGDLTLTFTGTKYELACELPAPIHNEIYIPAMIEHRDGKVKLSVVFGVMRAPDELKIALENMGEARRLAKLSASSILWSRSAHPDYEFMIETDCLTTYLKPLAPGDHVHYSLAHEATIMAASGMIARDDKMWFYVKVIHNVSPLHVKELMQKAHNAGLKKK